MYEVGTDIAFSTHINLGVAIHGLMPWIVETEGGSSYG